jgi:serine/threonine protein kinase
VIFNDLLNNTNNIEAQINIINYEIINQNIRDILTISREIVKTLKWFRRNNLVHLDIKPSNIMIEKKKFYKIKQYSK